MDVISDALRVIRLQGALFLNARLRAPWCVIAPSANELARLMSLPRECVATCHLIVDGRCSLTIDGGEVVHAEAGDVVVFPHGHAHVLWSGRTDPHEARQDAVELELPELARLDYGGDGDPTVAICGWFAYER